MNPQLSNQIISLLATLMLVVQLLMVVERMLMSGIRLFAVQSVLLACIATAMAFFHGTTHILWIAVLTLAGKGILIPWYLRRLVRQSQSDQESNLWFNPPSAMLLCGGMMLLAYIVARPFTKIGQLGSNTLAVAITLVLTGFFLMINRRNALNQVVALLSVENGIMLSAVALTSHGMPLVVELGIFFDVLVASMVLGILAYRIRETFSSMDVSKLTQLKE